MSITRLAEAANTESLSVLGPSAAGGSAAAAAPSSLLIQAGLNADYYYYDNGYVAFPTPYTTPPTVVITGENVSYIDTYLYIYQIDVNGFYWTGGYYYGYISWIAVGE